MRIPASFYTTQFFYFTKRDKFRRMVEQVKVPATRPDDLSLIPRTHRMARGS